ncbi:MAG: hypothetical protein HYZ35_00205 [Chloroflexi bacterium]|nr:hypothetical protein [Chloroflexota bacterium]
MRRLLLSLITLAAFAALAGCLPAAPPPAEPTPTLSPRAVGSVVALPTTDIIQVTPPAPRPTHAPLTDPVKQQWVQLAVDDLAQRLAVDPAQIGFVDFRDITWPDSSLGCPQPGMAYAQVLTDGYLIQLSVGKRLFEYHGGGREPPFLCENTP